MFFPPARRAAGPVLLLIIIVLFYWKFTLSGQYELMWTFDLATQVVPWMNVAARQWSQGTFPLWDPHLWGGQPLLGQMQPGVAYFLNWFLFSAPRKSGHLSADLFHWYFAVVHYMAAIFCYILCRDLRKSVPASIIAGLIFSLTGYLSSISWPQMLNSAVWTPLVFMFLLRSVEGRNPMSSALLSGMCLGLAWLAGHHQVPLLVSLATLFAWSYYAFRHRKPSTTIIKHAALAFLVCGLTGAFQILPAREYGKQSVRWVNAPDPVGWDQKVPYFVHEQFSLPPSSALGIVLPGMSSITAEPFVGFAALTLAIVGIRARWRDHRLRLFTFIGILGFVFAMGAYTPLQGIAYSLIPLIEKARNPAVAVYLFGFAVSVAAAYGVDALGRRLTRPYTHWHAKALGATGLLLAAALFVFNVAKIGYEPRLATAMLSALGVCAVLLMLERRAIRFRHALLLLAAILLVEARSIEIVGANKVSGTLMKDIQAIRSNGDIAAFLRTRRPARIAINDKEIQGNWAEYHDLDADSGYLASLSTNITSLPMHTRNAQSLWGVRYSFGPQQPGTADVEIFTGQSGHKVFERSDAFPRAWSVHRIDQVENRSKISERIDTDLQSFARSALMLTPPPPVEQCGGSESADYQRPNGNTVIVTATLACKGLLVVSDTFFPGWRAEIDGHPAEIHEVNGAMRGVVVPPGRHTVTMRYRPTSAILGALLTLSGIVAAIGIAIRTRASRDRP